MKSRSLFGADMGDVVESGDDIVPVVGTCRAAGLVDLMAKLAEEDDGWRIQVDEKGADESVPLCWRRRVISVELDDEVKPVREVACAAKKRNISSWPRERLCRTCVG